MYSENPLRTVALVDTVPYLNNICCVTVKLILNQQCRFCICWLRTSILIIMH